MSFKLWNFYDSVDIENLIIRHNLNKIKIVLYPLDEGYEIFMKINDKEESMYFTYQDSRVLDSVDYGLLPTILLSGICQAKEQYLYSNYVIVEVLDRRYQTVNDETKQFNEMHSSDFPERKYLTVLRITDNSIMKLTGIKSRLGDLREEQQWVSRNVGRLNLDMHSEIGNEDGYNFINTEWFQNLVQKKHVAKILHKKRNVQWNVALDGRFHPDSIHNIQHTRLKRYLDNNFHFKYRGHSGEIETKHKIQLNDDVTEKMLKLLENQKQNIFKLNPSQSPMPNHCHEECVHQMIIRSPLSGSNFKLILSRCPLHNRHWGHLIVDQWEGSSTKPIRFELPGGYGQGRRLLNQLSEMLGAKISMSVESNSTSDTNVIDQNISPKQTDNSSIAKCNSNDTIWESIESIMTKNIQSGKPLYDNRDTVNSSISVYGNAVDNMKKKKTINITKNKLLTNNSDIVFQTSSKTNASLKAASMNGELQQKQSMYSLKDLNLDDLF